MFSWQTGVLLQLKLMWVHEYFVTSINFIFPFLTSPTSNTIQPFALVILYNSIKTSCITFAQPSTFFNTEIDDEISSILILLNQHLNQLSAAYWTISKNGGEVTVKATVSDSISSVFLASSVRSKALFPK